MKRLTSILLAVLIATAAYVYAWPSANVPYFGAIILHVLVGIAFLTLLIFTLRPILREGATVSRLGWLLLALGGILGAILIYTGTRRVDWPLLCVHIGACVAGCALLFSGWAGKRGFLAGGIPAGVARSAICLAVAGLITAGAWWLRTVPWQESHRIHNPTIAPGHHG